MPTSADATSRSMHLRSCRRPSVGSSLSLGTVEGQQVVRVAPLVGPQPHAHVVAVAGRVLDHAWPPRPATAARSVVRDRARAAGRRRWPVRGPRAPSAPASLFSRLDSMSATPGIFVMDAIELASRCGPARPPPAAHADLDRLLAERARPRTGRRSCPALPRSRVRASRSTWLKRLAARRLLQLHVGGALGDGPVLRARLADRRVRVLDVGQRLRGAAPSPACAVAVSRSVAPGVALKAIWYSPRLKSGMKSPPRMARMGKLASEGHQRHAHHRQPVIAGDQPSRRS